MGKHTLEMPVVEGKPNAIEAKTFEEGGIGILEEVLQELRRVRVNLRTHKRDLVHTNLVKEKF